MVAVDLVVAPLYSVFVKTYFLNMHNKLIGSQKLNKNLYKKIRLNLSKPKGLLNAPSKSSFIIYLHTSKRNTRISLCNSLGVHLFSLTMGSIKKKSKRGDSYFAKDLFNKFKSLLDKYKIKKYTLILNGFGPTRRVLIRLISRTPYIKKKCVLIIDATPKSHNGCRRSKRRRL